MSASLSSVLDLFVTYKDAFFHLPFGVDVMLCAVQYPLFAWNGSNWLLKTLAGEKAHTSPGYRNLYDLFMLCYTGYCALMFYGLYSLLCFSELVPVMAGIQVGVILMKMILVGRLRREEASDSEMKAGKDASLYAFYLPLYVGYFALSYL